MTFQNRLLSTIAAVAIFSGTALQAEGTTYTGLDQIVEIIETDKGLQKKVPLEEIEEAAAAADRMNEIILEGIVNAGLANDNDISTADTRELNDYIYANYADEWKELHGDDEDGEETGFHLVQNDGAKTKLYGKNAINNVADSIYHLGFETHRKNRLLNEDGNKNKSFKKVGIWLDKLLAEDLGTDRLKNSSIVEVTGTTGTGLDVITETIYSDRGLQKRISTGDMREAAASADAMNHIILEAIDATGVGADGTIDKNDAKELNSYIVANYEQRWAVLHGDDEENEETGYHLAQSDGAKTKLYGKNLINNVADSIYHLGFSTSNKNRLENEDGNKNRSFKKVGIWLTSLLSGDLN